MDAKRSAENDPEHLYHWPFAQDEKLRTLAEAYRKGKDDDES